MNSTEATNDLAIDIVARWEDEVARGSRVTLEEMCGDRPELLPSVREIVRRLAAAAALFPSDAGFESDGLDRCPAGWIRIGHGASSVVYRGEDATFGTTVAFKVLHALDRHPSPADAERSMRRFEQEARILAQLKHDGIVRIFKTFGLGGRPVLEMEYLPGGSLLSHMGAVRGRGPSGVARFLERVARAVGFAHEHNIVHRDLKPSNILLDAAGRPCVTDFGVAKLIQAVDATIPDSSADTESESSGLTALGRQPGTRAYMAPEQFDPTFGRISPATDVWALGVILFELVNGTRPFVAESRSDWEAAVCRGPLPRPRWAAWRANRRLESIALRCLSRDPAKRYPSAAALADALAHAAGPAWRPWAVAAGIAIAATATAVVALTPRPHAALLPDSPSEAVHAAFDREARAAYRDCEAGRVVRGIRAFESLLDRVPADVPDLRAAIGANIDLWSATLTAEDGSYTHPEPIEAVAVDRDAKRLVVGDARGGVVVWDAAAGGVAKRLDGHDAPVFSAAIGPDGRTVATVDQNGVVRIWPVDGNATAPTDAIAVKDVPFALAVADDGRTIAVGVRRQQEVGVGFWNRDSGEYSAPTEWVKSSEYRSFATDSRTLVVPVGDGSAEVWDLVRRVRRPRLVSRPGAAIRSVALSHDGRTIATGGDVLQLWDATTGQLTSEECAEPGLEVIGFEPSGGAIAVRVNREHRLWQPAAGCFDPLAFPRPGYLEYWRPTAQHLIAIEGRKSVYRFRWPKGMPRALPVPRPAMVLGAVADDGGSRVAVVTATDRFNPKVAGAAGIDVWEPRTGQRIGTPIRPKDPHPFAFQFGPKGGALAYYSGQPPGPHPVRLFDPTSGKTVEMPVPKGTVHCIRYLRESRRWLTAGNEPAVRIWDEAGDARGSAALPFGGVIRSAVGPEGRLVVLGNLAGDVACVSVSASPPELTVQPLRPRIGNCDQVGLTADGSTVLALARGGQLWAAADGVKLQEVAGANDIVRFFPRPEGGGWVTGHRNGAVRWWTGPTAAPETDWIPAEGDPCVSLDPTGAVLITARNDGKAQAWSVATRLPLGPPVNHQKSVIAGVWGADGLLLTQSIRAVRVWTPLGPSPAPTH